MQRRPPFIPALEQASRFSWTDAAQRTQDVLQRAAQAVPVRDRRWQSLLEHGMEQQGLAKLHAALRHARSAGARLADRYARAARRCSMLLCGTVSAGRALGHCCTTRVRSQSRLRTGRFTRACCSGCRVQPSATARTCRCFLFFAEMSKGTRRGCCDLHLACGGRRSMVWRTSVRGKNAGPAVPCLLHSHARCAMCGDLFDEYFGPERMGKWASRFIFAPIAAGLRFYDKATANRVDLFHRQLQLRRRAGKPHLRPRGP